MLSCASSFFLFHGSDLLWQILYGWIWLSVLTNAVFRRAFGFGVSSRVRYTVEINVGSARSAWCGSSGAIEEVHLLRSGSRKALPLLIFLIHISLCESVVYQNHGWFIRHSIS